MPALVGYNSVAASVFLMRKRSIQAVTTWGVWIQWNGNSGMVE